MPSAARLMTGPVSAGLAARGIGRRCGQVLVACAAAVGAVITLGSPDPASQLVDLTAVADLPLPTSPNWKPSLLAVTKRCCATIALARTFPVGSRRLSRQGLCRRPRRRRGILAGADMVMTTSALLRRGPGHVTELLGGLTAWMDRKGFETVGELRGMLSAVAGRAAYGRTGYLSAIEQATHAYAPR